MAPSDADPAELVSPTAVRRRPPSGATDDHPLLSPLAEAQDAVARLEATATAASSAIVEGLRARIAYRWLCYRTLAQ